MSWRRFLVLVTQLPPESRISRTLHPAHVWSTTDYLLAHAVDRLAAGNWQRSGGKGARPRPLPRPTDRNRTKWGKPQPLHEVRARLDRWHSGGARPRHPHRRR